MEALRDWVRGIALVVLLAGFMELVMPQSGMRRYIRVVMGLLVLLTILAPVIGLLRGGSIPFDSMLRNALPETPDPSAVLREGERIRARNLELAAREYRSALEERLAELVASIEGVGRATVSVEIEGDAGSDAFGQVEYVRVFVSAPERSIRRVERVDLGGDASRRGGEGGPARADPELAARVRRAVSAFLGIDEARIGVAGLE